MLVDKPGREMPYGRAASRVRGRAPAAPYPPRGARGPAPPGRRTRPHLGVLETAAVVVPQTWRVAARPSISGQNRSVASAVTLRPVGTGRARPGPEMPASARTWWTPHTSRRHRGTPAA